MEEMTLNNNNINSNTINKNNNITNNNTTNNFNFPSFISPNNNVKYSQHNKIFYNGRNDIKQYKQHTNKHKTI